MRRVKLEGRQIEPWRRLDVNGEQVVQDRRSGMSLAQVAKKHSVSPASLCGLMKKAMRISLSQFSTLLSDSLIRQEPDNDIRREKHHRL